MPAALDISVELGDVATFDADVVVVKYARRFYGVAEVVARRLMSAGISQETLEPAEGAYRYVASRGALRAPNTLLIGVPPLQQFLYPQIQDFATTALSILSREGPATAHVAMTIHGGGYGLDESESLRSTLRGCREALSRAAVPAGLTRISIVDRDPKRVQRLRDVLHTEVPGPLERPAETSPQAHAEGATAPAKGIEVRAGAVTSPPAKRHAFVAMPFSAQMEDVYYFGIQAPVHSVGLLCERIDHSVFTGSIMEALLQKIESAVVVIADLSGTNENVFLEVGYAWGKGKPTILLAHQDLELPFDVRGHKCLRYESIKQLEALLASELQGLAAQGVIVQGTLT